MLQNMKDRSNKKEAASIIQNLLKPKVDSGLFDHNPVETAHELVAGVWAKWPNVYNGKREPRPQNITLAASALANIVRTLPIEAYNVLVFMDCLYLVLKEARENTENYNFNKTDENLLYDARSVFQYVSNKYKNSPVADEHDAILNNWRLDIDVGAD